ncbi:hypothetical protein [Cylindrospermum sp. FACHB-282]|uniref:hypothetical protein n=1 Tax=Cylindrospermum sp. FACHB-282 TaxID=2692794 RepID=UPI001682F247|nr:hypothetical protein [Cylindrospermum sp. FACHB-282]MBD2384869.1 hypothetical protein [Cylindrospermum sp. FACHB-282]
MSRLGSINSKACRGIFPQVLCFPFALSSPRTTVWGWYKRARLAGKSLAESEQADQRPPLLAINTGDGQVQLLILSRPKLLA